MSRTDRDKEIVVSLASASRSDIAQYEIMPDPVPGYYGQPYDLGSVMHYYATVSDFVLNRWKDILSE